MKGKKWHFFVMAAVILVLGYVSFFGLKIPIGRYDFTVKGSGDMRFGIDIRGGVDAVYQAKDLNRTPTSDELESARTVIETRLDQNNILDRDVTIDKDNGYILVRFPWKSTETDFDPQKAIAELGETAKLTFRDPDGNTVVDGTNVDTAVVVTDNEHGGYAVSLKFNAQGAKDFSTATAKLVGQPMSIYMDETEVSSPTVNEAITGGDAIISGGTGGFSYDEAKDLANKINSGALPFSMETKNNSVITPTLGSGALETMVKAGLVAFGLICLFLIAVYRLPGVVACLALLLQVSGQLLALSLPQITVTLPGIAAIILSIGMGVDANIIISERIAEEMRKGKRLRSAIETGFQQAFSSVFDGNITVMIVSVILMILGSGAMLSFAYSLLTGVILNFVAGVVSSRVMIRSLSLFQPLQHNSWYMKGRKAAA